MYSAQLNFSPSLSGLWRFPDPPKNDKSFSQRTFTVFIIFIFEFSFLLNFNWNIRSFTINHCCSFRSFPIFILIQYTPDTPTLIFFPFRECLFLEIFPSNWRWVEPSLQNDSGRLLQVQYVTDKFANQSLNLPANGNRKSHTTF